MREILDVLNFFDLGVKDLLQILLVAYALYRLLLAYTGTRAFQILFGFVVLVSAYALAQLFEFNLISAILSQVFTYGAFALIVVFQPELRNALAQLGRSPLWRIFAKFEEKEIAGEIVRAAERLAKAKIGGIIAIEGDVELADFVDRGTPIDAQVSAELLTTIFTPYSPLHDGAVIIKGDRVVSAASVILRLSESPIVDRSLGTRHRAALGLSEETDALVVVISEETGQLSLAHRGELERGLRPQELRERLASGGRRPAAVEEGVPRTRGAAEAAEKRAVVPAGEAKG
ncbi:MAG: diadenylate cyclase CdaA [Gemmatimonadota bacterium]